MLASPHPGERSCRRRPGLLNGHKRQGAYTDSVTKISQVCETNQGKPSVSICDAAPEGEAVAWNNKEWPEGRASLSLRNNENRQSLTHWIRRCVRHHDAGQVALKRQKTAPKGGHCLTAVIYPSTLNKFRPVSWKFCAAIIC